MSLSSTVLLIILSCFTSAMTAAVGFGGGLFLIAVMANILPPIAVIPFHGIVQFCSNVSRTMFSLNDVVWKILPSFIGGILLGGLCALPLLSVIPPEYLTLPLACFILLMTWLPKIKMNFRLPGAFLSLGTMQGFISPFLGSTGLLNFPFLLRGGYSGNQVIITQSALMTIVHLGKVFVYGVLGFSLTEYIPLMLGMILAVIVGSWIGTILRQKLKDANLQRILRAGITLLAVRMIWLSLV